MNLTDSKLFMMMKSQMQYLTDRQAVLAQNIAQLDVPGAKPKDLQKPDFSAMVQDSTSKHIALARTNPAHMTPANSSAHGGFKIISGGHGHETTPVNNSIVMEEQMMNVAETTTKYQETSSVYKKMLEMLKTATGNKG